MSRSDPSPLQFIRFDERRAACLRQQFGWSTVAERDVEWAQSQLGRPVRGLWAICVRCTCNRPQVVANAPLLNKQCKQPPGGEDLFPTLFWLCCRELYSEIGRLEAAGGVAQARAWLAEAPNAQAALQSAHARTAQLRSELVPEQTRAWMAAEVPGPYAVLTQTGVAGIRGGGVKCLHAHVADHLALGDNPVGAWALERMGWRGCGCAAAGEASAQAGTCSC